MIKTLPFRHVICASQFTREIIDDILLRAKTFQNNSSSGFLSKRQKGMVMATYFAEPSTRTRLSFESAMQRLGGKIISIENGSLSSSEVKGELLEDTVKTISQYADVIVIRHPRDGAAQIASESSDVPIINAGDGDGEHPTQALLDLYTIQRERGTIDGANIVFFGDTTKARTVKSLTAMLKNFKDVTVDIIDPYAGTINHWEHLLNEKLPAADVVYITRLQRERWTPGFVNLQKVCFGQEQLNLMKQNAMVLHPLPRTNELDHRIDSDPRAAYWKQVKNGMFLRIALISMMQFDTPSDI